MENKTLDFDENIFYIIGGVAGADLAAEIYRNNYTYDYEHITIEELEYNIDSFKCSGYFVAIGDNNKRFEIINLIYRSYSIFPINLIHKTADVCCDLGYGNLICKHAIINNNSIIGNGCIINTNAVVEHDNIIGDYCQIGPSATLAGYVKVGNFTNIWTNATIIPKIKIGNDAIIGAGAVVINDVDSGKIVVGNPAKEKGK